MKINRFETQAFVIGKDAVTGAMAAFKKKASDIQKNAGSKVETKITYKFTPLMIGAAQKLDKEGLGKIVKGMTNVFHIGLNDACMFYFHHSSMKEGVTGAFMKSHGPQLERKDILLDLATLSPKALQTLGWLLDNGTQYYDKMDVPTQAAVKELNGRKYADIWRGVDREGDIASVVREIFEAQPVTPMTKVKPLVPLPRFFNGAYNLSTKLKLTEYIEDDVELEPIVHAPDKINYILGTLFNCSLIMKKLVYLPVIECLYRWDVKSTTDRMYIPCYKKGEPAKYKAPKRLKTVTIGVKGHGLDSVPFEDVAIDFSNVAGMNDVKEKLKEAIIYPIAHPELSEQYGNKGGGGVLFYGPPGCGKSFIMKATVGEAGVNFYSVAVNDIIGEDVDTAAKRIDDVFAEARSSAPSIIFFDEIDALGGQRTSGQSSSEHRLINQMLINMEGVGANNENVLVVGSTNAPWDMDPALRRAGRFTTQILIPPPDEESRRALLKVYLKGRPLADDINLDLLVELSDNYSSADLTAIVEESAKIPWRETIHGEQARPVMMSDFKKVFEERESSLTPWLRLAEKQLRESGEADVFEELADYVFKRAGGIEMVSAPSMNFSDVGGLEDVKEEIRNKIVYPLQHPELSEEYGRKLGGGILFYGPPGCGKTYIARATAGECGASFFNVSITDLMSPEEGVTEKRLHAIFERASRNTPAIIFFDEIDALAGQRTSAEGGAQRRLINQFLVEMDGFEKKEGVVVIGATNAPWDIDPALRRAGRFSDQVFLPPPDDESRQQIFDIHLKNRPMEENVQSQYLAKITDGFSSADISLICDEAAKIPWKESVKTGVKRPINVEDFKTIVSDSKPSIGPWLKQAEKQLRASGEFDTYVGLADYVFKRAGGIEMVSSMSMNFSNVGGLEDVKEEIRAKVIYPMQHPELSEEYGRKMGGGLLFYGPPGCGKTYIARATAGECGAAFFNVKITDLMSPNEGETEKRLHSIFERASRNTPAIIFFDEIDALAGQRTSSEGGAQRRLINQFLVEMDGFEKKEGVIILAATNAPWDIDPALRRAGRFSDQVFLPPPDETGREQIFNIHLKDKPIDEGVSANELAKMTDGFSSADVGLICDEAAKIPWKESVKTGEKRKVNMEDFKTIIGERNPSITPWLKQAEKQLRESGESDVYPGLSEYVFKRVGGLDSVSTPDMNFEQVAGLESVKQEIRNKIVYPLQHPDLAEKYGRSISGGLLLYGPPGCGKTYIARATAGEVGSSFYNVKITDLMSPNEGETEKRLHSIFERASRNTPAIIFFDEIDAVAGQRTSAGGGAERRLINQFLVEMDGFEKKEGVIILAATNAPWDIDPALRRPGRFSDQIFLPPPDLESRESIFKLHSKKLPVEKDLDYRQLAEITDGFSAADLKNICDGASKIPWEESVSTGVERNINLEDFKKVIADSVSSLGPWWLQAKNELLGSGQQDSYPTLLKFLNEHLARQGQKSQAQAPQETAALPPQQAAAQQTQPAQTQPAPTAPVSQQPPAAKAPPATEQQEAQTQKPPQPQQPASELRQEPSLEDLVKKKQHLEFMLKDLKDKVEAGVVDAEVVKDLEKDYVKQLLELDAQINFKKSG